MIPVKRGPNRTIVAYLACISCGRWMGVTTEVIRELLCPWYFRCVYCSLGRGKACETPREYPDRAEPTPARLDTRAGPMADSVLPIEDSE